jgi:hypothetical protein
MKNKEFEYKVVLFCMIALPILLLIAKIITYYEIKF